MGPIQGARKSVLQVVHWETCSYNQLQKYLRPPGGGGGYSHTLPIRVCAAQRGRDFEAPGLERGILFRRVF